ARRQRHSLSFPTRRSSDLDYVKIERDVTQACRNWADDFNEQVRATLGEAAGSEALARFGAGFPPGYSERFNPATGVVDIRHLLRSEEHTSELQSRENLVCR